MNLEVTNMQPIDGGPALNSAIDAATAAMRFPTEDAALRFRNCGILAIEGCIIDTEAPTARTGLRARDLMLVGGGLLAGYLVCKQVG